MNILLYDVETSPNLAQVFGLFNQNLSIKQVRESSRVICWAAKWYGKPKIYYNSIHKSPSFDMVDQLHGLLSEADAVCHYNGRSFDTKIMNREFLLHDLNPPEPSHEIDLLNVVRKRFKFPSNKLDFVCQELGLGGKTDHEGFELWVKCLEGDSAAWKRMERYNKNDVKMLEKLYEKLLPWIQTHPNHALYTDTDRPLCTNCGSAKVQSRGYDKTKTQMYRRFQCQECFTWLRSRFNETQNRENILTQVK